MFLLLSASTFSLCYTVYKLLLNSPFITLPSPSNNLQWLPMVSSPNKVLPAFQGHHDQIWSFHSLSTTCALHMCKSQGGSLLFHAHLASCLQFIPQVFYLVISSHPKFSPAPPCPVFCPSLSADTISYNAYCLAQFDIQLDAVVCCYLIPHLYHSCPQ